MPDSKKKKGKEKKGGKESPDAEKDDVEKGAPESATLLKDKPDKSDKSDKADKLDKPKLNGKSKRQQGGPSKTNPLIRAYSTESGPDLHKSQQQLNANTNHHKHDHLGTSCTLLPPAITYDEVATAPNSPVNEGSGIMMHNFGLSASAQHLGQGHLDARSASVTPSGSLLAVNRPYELRESTLTVNYPDSGVRMYTYPPGAYWKRRYMSDWSLDGDEGEEVALLYSRHEKIPMKDFAAEIRASLDVENFLNQAVLLLDVSDSSLDAILDRMLKLVLNKTDEPHTTVADAKKAIYVHESVQKLAKTIQGCSSYTGGFDYDQSWISILCTMTSLQKRHVAIARLRSPANLGRQSQEVYFIILVAAPTKQKGTKNALETGRTFATLFADMDLRQRLLMARTEEDFKRLLWEHTKELAEEQSNTERKNSDDKISNFDGETQDKSRCFFGRGVRRDFLRRLPHYWSDFKDGVVGPRTLQKTLSTTVFLYFACLLPSIALGMLNDNNTHGKIGVRKVIFSQIFGGMVWALLSGQPMTVVLTTAPLALFTKVIYSLSKEWEVKFFAMYALTGIWNMVFLLIYAFFDLSRLMKWSTRSTEEIFGLFISIAFMVDAFKDAHKSFYESYFSCDETSSIIKENMSYYVTTVAPVVTNITTDSESLHHEVDHLCLRENSLLFLLLMLGTLWLGHTLYNFTKTPYLNAGKRELLADYALPTSVLVMSFFGSYVFRSVKLEAFNYNSADRVVDIASFDSVTWKMVFGAMGMGFCLSLLFFMDQNISSAMVNNPANKMKKGPAYHWDLMVIGIINGLLTISGMPMVHGALPHSPLHVRAMADVEEYVEQGHVYEKIVKVRETRITTIVSHILIGLSGFFLLPYPLKYIPRPVLDGLFLYLAINALGHSQLFERILLLITEQAAYPPHHYIRSVPQRKVHTFTLTQMFLLGIMCAFGFSPFPYLKMVFPVLLLLLLPIRHVIFPLIIEKKYLESLDGT